MKRIALLTAGLLFAASALFAQYEVIHVRGGVKRKTSGAPLKVGDNVSAAEVKDPRSAFHFDADAVAAVYSPNEGRLTLSPNPQELAAARVGDVGLTRGASVDEFARNVFALPRFLAFSPVEIELSDDDAYKLFEQPQKTFILAVWEKGKERRVNLVRTAEVTPGDPESARRYALFISKDMIFGTTTTENQVDSMLVYYAGTGKAAEMGPPIGRFNPVFADEHRIKQELAPVIDALLLAGMKDKILPVVMANLREYYGAPYEPNVRQWLDAHFNLKLQPVRQ